MRLRGLLIAAVALAALAVAYHFSNKAEKAKEGKPATDTTPKVLSIPEDQIAQVELARKGAETTVLKRGADSKWQITAPKPLAADQDSMNSLTGALSSLNSDRIVEDKVSDLGAYGLNAPTLTVTVAKKDGKTEKLLVGDETPTGSGAFVKLESDPRVFTIASFTKTSLDKTSKDLRDKRLIVFDSDKITRVELNAKKQPVEFGKNNKNEWVILKPRSLRADGGQVDELIRKLKDAKMDTAVSDEDARKHAAAFASGTPVAVAKVTDAMGTRQLEIRKDKDKNYYARGSAAEGVYKVTSDLGDGLDKGLDDLRNKKVFDFGWNDPTKVELRDGAKSVSFAKSGDKWISGGKTMDSATVQNLIDKLRDLAATKFPEQGFANPVFEATVTSSDGKTVEKVAIAKQGENCFARRDNEPAVYQIDPKSLDEIRKAASDVKEAQPAKDEKKK